jgi:hypothetical protein
MDATQIDALLQEWSYRCPKGYPDLNDRNDLKILSKILKEWNIEIPVKSDTKIKLNNLAETDTRIKPDNYTGTYW